MWKIKVSIIFQSQDKHPSIDKGRNRSDWHLHIMITLPKWWSTWTVGSVAATQLLKLTVPLTHSPREMRSLLLPAATLDQSAPSSAPPRASDSAYSQFSSQGDTISPREVVGRKRCVLDFKYDRISTNSSFNSVLNIFFIAFPIFKTVKFVFNIKWLEWNAVSLVQLDFSFCFGHQLIAKIYPRLGECYFD